MRPSPFLSVCASSILLLLVACTAAPAHVMDEDDSTGSPIPNSPKSENGQASGKASGKGSGTSSSSSSGGGSSSGGNPAPPPGTAACGGEPTSDACWTCCENRDANVAPRAKKISKDWQACACASSTCADACGSDYCANPDPDADAEDDACIACLDENTDDCDDAEDEAWEQLEGEAIYQPVDECAAASKCDEKPEEDD